MKYFKDNIKLTISIFINQLKYPVNHLVWSQKIAFLIQLSVAGLLQSINGLKVTGKHLRTPTLTVALYHYSTPSTAVVKK